MGNRDVLISGAGVAGQALAYWLSRSGFSPTVVERAPAPRGGGQAVDLRGAAIEVAARMGILDAVRKQRTQTRGTSYVNSSGKRLASMDAAFGVIDPADVEIVRGDLGRILYEATRDDVEYIFGDSVTGIAEQGQEVRVTFERAPARTFGLVAGADGLHSAVRAAAFGPEARFLHHLGLYLAVFTCPNDLGLDRWQLIYAEPASRSRSPASVIRPRPGPSSSSPRRRCPTTTARRPRSRRSWPRRSPGQAGRFRGCWPRCAEPAISTSTRPARSGRTAGRRAACAGR